MIRQFQVLITTYFNSIYQIKFLYGYVSFEVIFIKLDAILGDQVENDKNAPRKLSLDKSCPNCFKNRKEKRKMAVKFNFDEVDSTNGDAWVEFTCHFCKKYV